MNKYEGRDQENYIHVMLGKSIQQFVVLRLKVGILGDYIHTNNVLSLLSLNIPHSRSGQVVYSIRLLTQG